MSEADFLENVLKSINTSIDKSSTDLLTQMAHAHFKSSGKMLRPQMIYHLGKTLSVDISNLVLWASCCEMLHNATLIHDDLQDGDHFRRGQPTIWKQYGAAQAINAGDFLLLLAPQFLAEMKLDADRKLQLMGLYSKMATQIVNGQSFEPSLNQNFDLETLEKNYYKCITQKTSILFSAAAEGVMILKGAPLNDTSDIAQIFLNLGNIFQIQDDVLDLYGDKKRGEIGCDIKEGKMSYLVVTFLLQNPDQKDSIKKILLKSRTETTDQDVETIIQLFHKNQTLQRVIQNINTLLSRIKNEIKSDLGVFKNKQLCNYITEFSNEILKPIQHLMNSYP